MVFVRFVNALDVGDLLADIYLCARCAGCLEVGEVATMVRQVRSTDREVDDEEEGVAIREQISRIGDGPVK